MKKKSNNVNNGLKKIKLKLAILGDSQVGKTNMLYKYVMNKFLENYLATVGMDHLTKVIKTPKFEIEVQIMDTAGQERYHSIALNSYKSSNGIIFVYDITNRKSFESLKEWINSTDLLGSIDRVICGNKVDMESKREVSFKELQTFGSKRQIEFFETSAKTGHNIDKAFRRLVDIILENKTDEEIIKEFSLGKKGLTLSSKKNQKLKEKCCKS